MSAPRESERRRVKDRRKQERRHSMRYGSGTLIVVDGVTWIDDEGNDRRRHIRRREDREKIARTILETKA
ncbi:MAG: hypothetical protein ACREDR_49030 [Blastocatellia bacterium]